MKILITTDAFTPMVNGVVVSISNLVAGLTARGHDVRVLALSPELQARHEGQVYYLPALNMERIYPGARAAVCFTHPFIREICAWHPAVVHSQSEFTSFRFARVIAHRCGAPHIHTYHTLYEDYTHYLPIPGEGLRRLVVAGAVRMLLDKTSLVLAPSEKARQSLLAMGVTTPMEILPTGIDLAPFSAPADRETRLDIRRRAGAGEQDILLTAVGRVAREKNLDELLELLRLQTDRRMRLMIVGDGPCRRELEERARALRIENRVFFTGMVSPQEVPAYYKAGDVFVCASVSETQGLTYVEALASGLPALCRKDTCLAGVVRNGENGYQYADAAGFEKGLGDILSGREQFSAAAKASAVCFSQEVFAARAEGIYRREMLAHVRLSKKYA